MACEWVLETRDSGAIVVLIPVLIFFNPISGGEIKQKDSTNSPAKREWVVCFVNNKDFLSFH